MHLNGHSEYASIVMQVCASIYVLCLSALSPGEEVLQLLHRCSPINLEELKKRESLLPQEDSEYICLLNYETPKSEIICKKFVDASFKSAFF